MPKDYNANMELNIEEWAYLINDLNSKPEYNKNLINLLKTPLIFKKGKYENRSFRKNRFNF